MAFRTLVIASLVGIVGLAGCVDGGSGSASIYVKDAPTDDFDEIHVLFSKVEVHRGGGDDDGEDDGEWVMLVESTDGIDVDLLDASGNRSAFLGESDLEAGNYSMIRITVIEAYGIQDGERSNFTVPSGVLRIVRGFDVEAGQETKITVDLNLDRSLTQAGQGQWIMTPVIGKVYSEIVADDQSGEDVHSEGQIQEDPALAA